MSSGQKWFAEQLEEQDYINKINKVSKLSTEQLLSLLELIQRNINCFSFQDQLTKFQHEAVDNIKKEVNKLLK